MVGWRQWADRYMLEVEIDRVEECLN